MAASVKPSPKAPDRSGLVSGVPVCTVCTHPEVEAIDRALLAGTAVRAVAGTYPGVSRSAMGRHRVNHLQQEEPRAPALEPIDVLAELHEHYELLKSKMRLAGRGKGGGPAFLALSREVRITGEEIARLQADPEVVKGLTPGGIAISLAEEHGAALGTAFAHAMNVAAEVFDEVYVDGGQAINLGQAFVESFFGALRLYGQHDGDSMTRSDRTLCAWLQRREVDRARQATDDLKALGSAIDAEVAKEVGAARREWDRLQSERRIRLLEAPTPPHPFVEVALANMELVEMDLVVDEETGRETYTARTELEQARDRQLSGSVR